MKKIGGKALVLAMAGLSLLYTMQFIQQNTLLVRSDTEKTPVTLAAESQAETTIVELVEKGAQRASVSLPIPAAAIQHEINWHDFDGDGWEDAVVYYVLGEQTFIQAYVYDDLANGYTLYYTQTGDFTNRVIQKWRIVDLTNDVVPELLVVIHNHDDMIVQVWQWQESHFVKIPINALDQYPISRLEIRDWGILTYDLVSGAQFGFIYNPQLAQFVIKPLTND